MTTKQQEQAAEVEKSGEEPKTILRFIKKGRNTATTHLSILTALGFEVEDREKVLAVTCNEVIEGEVDISTDEKCSELIGHMLETKAVFSYKTKFKFSSGQILSGIMATGRLGKLSVLLTKPATRQKKVNEFDAIINQALEAAVA